MDTNLVVVVLVGLPGSGKTTLCQGLQAYQQHHGNDKLKIIHLCYDDLIPLSLQRRFVEQRRIEARREELKGVKEEEKRVEVEEEDDYKGIKEEEKRIEGAGGNDYKGIKEEEERIEEAKENDLKGVKEEKKRIEGVKGDDCKGIKEEEKRIYNNNKRSNEEEEEFVEEKITEGAINDYKEIKEEKERHYNKNKSKDEENDRRRKEEEKEYMEGKRTEGEEKERHHNKDKSTEEDEETHTTTSDDWKTSRRKIHTQVDRFLHYINTGNTDSGTETETEKFLGTSLNEINRDSKHILLLDDNFYYRSMRYEYYQLSRKHSAAYLQLYLACSTEEAARHNTQRDAAVAIPADAVTAMGERLQSPQPDTHPWEANTCEVTTGDVCKAWGKIMASFHLGLTPVLNRALEIEEARLCCSKNVLHQADIFLRGVVKGLVKEQQRDGNDSVSKVARSANAARVSVLACLRTAGVPLCFAYAVTQENREEFEAFLEAQMKKVLADEK